MSKTVTITFDFTVDDAVDPYDVADAVVEVLSKHDSDWYEDCDGWTNVAESAAEAGRWDEVAPAVAAAAVLDLLRSEGVREVVRTSVHDNVCGCPGPHVGPLVPQIADAALTALTEHLEGTVANDEPADSM